jgi:hypothetical protein
LAFTMKDLGILNDSTGTIDWFYRVKKEY